MKTGIENGLLRTFRLFAGLETSLYLALVIYMWIVPGGQETDGEYFYYFNTVSAAALLVYLNLPWLERHLGRLYLPLALAVATVLPILTNRAFLDATSSKNSAAPLVNAWQWMPMLFVPLVLIAWQYDMAGVVLFSIVTGYIDLTLVFTFAEKFSLQPLPVLSISIIRTASFIVVGYIVVQLMHTQREQRRELMDVNQRLGRHAMTLQQLAVSRERNRLARELHDTLAHTLSGLAVHLEAMKTALDPADSENQEMLDHALSVTRTGLQETRRALKDLRATNLDDMGLELSLNKLVNSFRDRTEIEIDFSISANIDSLNPQVEQGIYRVAQEALENVVRHANADRVEFHIENHAQHLLMTVKDNGNGFDVERVQLHGDHYGIHGMTEWAEMIGGKLKVESKPDKGTKVTLVLEDNNGRTRLDL